MATNWKVLSGNDLRLVLSLMVIKQANQNISEENKENDPLNEEEGTTRRDLLVSQVVAEMRGCVQAAHRQPLSVTAGAVPPESVMHVLNRAAYQLINSTPNLPMAIYEGQPAFQKLYDAAQKYFDEVRRGDSVTEASDPTGQDYLTAVSEENPAINGIDWGDLNATDDEYAAGYKTLSSGGTVALPVDDMTTT